MFGYNYKNIFYYNKKLLSCLNVINIKVFLSYKITIEDIQKSLINKICLNEKVIFLFIINILKLTHNFFIFFISNKKLI